jgi:hypothetical protein
LFDSKKSKINVSRILEKPLLTLYVFNGFHKRVNNESLK